MVASIVSAVSSAVSKSKVSARKRRANQRNAKKSTGPITWLGKLMASRNAVTHAVFSAHVVLPGEHVPSFIFLRQCYINSLQPLDLLQFSFVDRIVADQWRLRRLDESEHRLFELQAYDQRDMLRQCREGDLEVGDDAQVNARWQRIDDVIEPMTKEQFETFAKDTTTPALVMASLMETSTSTLDRYALYRQRLQNSIQRALRELRALQKIDKDADDRPLSPYMKTTEQLNEELKSMGVTVTAPEKPADQPTDATKDESSETEKMENEPTEEKSATTPTPEEACGEAVMQESNDPCPEPVLRAALGTSEQVQLNNSNFG